MKVLMINGSSREYGCTYTALRAVADGLAAENITSEIVWLGDKAQLDCIGCGACRKLGKCIYDDDIVNELLEKAKLMQGFVFGSPVYYAHPSGRLLSVLDRLFYAGARYFAYKPGAAVASARRAGTTAALDVLHKYFMINKMPVVTSQYWNMVHGRTPEEVREDIEGVQTMRILAQNMSWLMKSLEMSAQNGLRHPEPVARQNTNFIR